MAEADDLRSAFQHLLQQLETAEQELHRFHAADDPAGLARGYQHLGRQLVKGFEEHLLRDADHPFGRVLDDRIRTGGDNPDQRYLFAPIRGGEAYRVWGRKGSAARIELQLYRREPYGAEDVSVGYLPGEAIAFGDDGTFTVELGPDVTGPSTLVNPPEATILNIRQIWSVWDDTDPGAVYVDRVGWEGARKTTDSPTMVAARIRGAADDIASSVRCWPELIESGPLTFLENQHPRATHVSWSEGRGRRPLDVPRALRPRTRPGPRHPHSTHGRSYRGSQLADLWFGSLEYSARPQASPRNRLITPPTASSTSS